MLNKLRNAVLLVVGVLVAFWAVTALVDVVQGGDMEPPGAPGPTMLPLDEMPPAWHQLLPANDGAAGPDPPAGCNSSRFECVMNNEAVLDKETGLVWSRWPDIGTLYSWAAAVNRCPQWENGGRKGWRLATAEELASLVDPAQSDPALPNGHPFVDVSTAYDFWSVTTLAGDSSKAYAMSFFDGSWNYPDKSIDTAIAWCVRGGQGHDGY